jgi:hypothetical protein
MTTRNRTCFLIWDGFYAPLGGRCNQGTNPISTTSGIQTRLRNLGFRCGPIDGKMGRVTKDALERFARRIGLQNPTNRSAAKIRLQQVHDEGSPVYELGFWKRGKSREAAPVTASRSDTQRQGQVDVTISTTGSIAVRVDQVPTEFVADTNFAGIRIALSGYNKIKSLMWRVYRNYEAPGAGDPNTNDDAHVPDIQRLVYQEVLNRRQIEKLLDQFEGEGLNTDPATLLGTHSDSKAWILRNNRMAGTPSVHKSDAPYKVKVWVSTASNAFDRFKGDQDSIAEARARTYIEQEIDRLRALRERAEAERQAQEDAEQGQAIQDLFADAFDRMELMAAMQGEELSEEDREPEEEGEIDAFTVLAAEDGAYAEEEDEEEPEAAPPAEEEDVGPSPNPTVIPAKLVHDEANRLHQEEMQQDNEARTARGKRTFMNPELWTPNSAHGVNLIEQPCPEHDLAFHLNCIIRPDTFITERLFKEPLETYINLRQRHTAHGDNFQYGEIREPLLNVRRHLDRMTQSLCCGEDQWLEQTIKDDVTELLNELKPECDALFPALGYHDCIEFCRKFMDYLDYIVWHTKTVPEGRFYDPNWNDLARGDPESGKLGLLRQRRLLVDGKDFPVVAGVNWDEANPRVGQAGMARTGTDAGGVTGTCQLNDLPGPSDLFLFPSYNPLDAGSFTYFRQVPIFLLGMIDIPFLNPDGNRASPANFFNHDAFHIRWASDRGGPYKFGVQQWGTLYRRLRALTAEPIPAGTPPEQAFYWAHEQDRDARFQGNRIEVYTAWHRNVKRLNRAISELGDPNQREALEVILFSIYHEPIKALVRPPYRFCVVCEADPIIGRLNFEYNGNTLLSDLKHRIAKGEFGVIPPATVAMLDWAQGWLLANAERLCPNLSPWTDVSRTMYFQAP